MEIDEREWTSTLPFAGTEVIERGGHSIQVPTEDAYPLDGRSVATGKARYWVDVRTGQPVTAVKVTDRADLVIDRMVIEPKEFREKRGTWLYSTDPAAEAQSIADELGVPIEWIAMDALDGPFNVAQPREGASA